MREKVGEQVKATLQIVRWCVIAYAVVVLVGFHLIPMPDWVMAPALLYTKLIKGTLSLVLPDAISAVIAIFATILTPVLIIIYSTSEN
ncbi:hypothetical protein R7D97_24505 [Vibrio sp. Vb5031]|uniref:hypothetical protein n=1 Tax=Vibrio TaxID=662 RepID=UPI00072064CB|nr:MULTISPECIES: hypothetical protein [Vibrio]ALR91728.1 hypothetical protein AT730_04715 [Vibrio alginolyticus]EGQ9113548.1 hypothetical protein [Vibrio alginolyticus]EHA1101071.1 hypothetical protein [Vibrio alginolyticus]EHA1123194.1 hypothetical protein [Vibrio alginolyticus]ELA6663431.1 hypothetical protein [Vibrio alginolyticus]